MAEARTEIDAVGAQGAGELLKNVIDFIGKTPGGGKETHVLGRGPADRLS